MYICALYALQLRQILRTIVFRISYLVHDRRNFATITALSYLYIALLVIWHNDTTTATNSAVL